MQSKIRVLDEQTINQIAAGEVIENPASVVKELVENSLDAGSTDICVEIKTGGRQLIRITDNGCGMNKDDALLCLERHATSKIRNIDDIHSIDTMGFRGEAIPSIASISKFTLMTTTAENPTEGTMISVDGGKVMQCCSVAHAPGTTIEVKSLFFNVPVRKKFQKSPVYDSNEVLKMLTNLALGYPEIKFQLISDQKSILKTHFSEESSFQEKLNHRLQDVMGNDFCDSSCYIEASKGACRLEGFIGLPSHTRHNRTGQTLFINRRAVYCPLVSFAIREGYGASLPTNRHPVYVLHLTLPGKMVDVNVHPQKKEVRLRNEIELKEMIMAAVRNGMQKQTFPMPTFEPLPSPQPTPAWELPPMPLHIIERPSPSPLTFPFIEEKVSPQLLPESQLKPPSYVKVLTTIRYYIIIDPCGWKELPQLDGMYLIDQKAAHSRIIYEELQTKSKHASSVQTLLIPYSFSVAPFEAAILLEQLDSLNNMGINIHQAGPQSFLIDAIPQSFGNTDIQQFISDMVLAMREFNDPSRFKTEQEKQIAIAASKASVSQRQKLSLEESQSLVNRLIQCKQPFQCPLGKPTVAHFTFDEIAKRFKC